jgi:hypothetical protein
MLKKGFFELVFLALLFFLPRFVFFYWTTHYSTAYASHSIISSPFSISSIAPQPSRPAPVFSAA